MTDIRRGEGRFGEELTPRERFNRCMHYQHVDYISHIEFGYWDELKQDWMAQGHLPKSLRQRNGLIPDRAVEEFFGVEQFESFSARIGAFPLREREVVEETEDTITYRDGLGVLRHEQSELLDGTNLVFPGEHVHRVLHGIRRNDGGVVAGNV